jgi:hypothetical protein
MIMMRMMETTIMVMTVVVMEDHPDPTVVGPSLLQMWVIHEQYCVVLVKHWILLPITSQIMKVNVDGLRNVVVELVGMVRLTCMVILCPVLVCIE